MAKKKSKQQQESAAAVEAIPVEQVDETEEDDDEEDELELLQVDVGDMIKMKQILDETVVGAIAENIKEDFRLDNFKLSIMTAACLFACVAQFAPIPFPDSRPVLGICCCLYFVFSGILQFVMTFVDKDCIMISEKKEDSKNANLKKYGIRVRSNFPRFSEFYTLILEFQSMEGTPCVEQTWSVGKFFDVEGMFDEVGMTQEIQKVYDRLEKSQYDDVKEKKNQ